jgi:hypothetical protein
VNLSAGDDAEGPDAFVTDTATMPVPEGAVGAHPVTCRFCLPRRVRLVGVTVTLMVVGEDKSFRGTGARLVETLL